MNRLTKKCIAYTGLSLAALGGGYEIIGTLNSAYHLPDKSVESESAEYKQWQKDLDAAPIKMAGSMAVMGVALGLMAAGLYEEPTVI